MASITIGRRFAQLIQHLGISKNAFAQSLGKTATVVQHLVDERNKPGYDLLCKVFEVYPTVSKDWLLLGQGPMLLSDGSGAPGAAPAAFKGAEAIPTPLTFPNPAAEIAVPVPVAAPSVGPTAAPAPAAEAAPAPAATAPFAASVPTPTPALNATAPASAETYLTAALHAQHLQHQLALAEQRNQHLLAQQRLMQQMLELAQRR